MIENHLVGTELNQDNDYYFSLSQRKKSSFFGIFYLLALGFPLVCFITLISSLFLSFIIEYFGFRGGPSVLFIVFIFWGIVWFSQLFTGIRELRISENTFMVRAFLKKSQYIQKDDLTQVSWKGDKIRFFSQKETISLNLKNLTLQENIQVRHLFTFKWLPYELLPKPLQLQRDQLNEQRENMQQIFENPVSSSTGNWPLLLYRIIGILALLIITGLFSWFLFATGDSSKYMVTILFIVTVVPIASLLIYSSRSRQIKVDSTGITYQAGKKINHFDWGKINTIFWSRNQQRFQIWEKGNQRYATIYYKHMKSNEIDMLFSVVLAGSYLLDVPFAMN